MQNNQFNSQTEGEFYNRMGEDILRREENLVVFNPTEFLAGSTDAFNYMIGRIGEIKDKKVLDYGCGTGWLGVYLAKKYGARVEGFDISEKLIEVARKRAEVNETENEIHFQSMKAERLKYPDETFDVVTGISIIHHVDLEKARWELKRVMKKGGRAFFLEPLGENIIFEFARNHIFTHYHGLSKDKSTERPLKYKDIEFLGKEFSCYRYKEFQLVSGIARLTGDNLVSRLKLYRLDNFILSHLSFLKKYCRLVVIELVK